MKAFFRIVESGYTKDFNVIYKIYCYEKREMLHNSCQLPPPSNAYGV